MLTIIGRLSYLLRLMLISTIKIYRSVFSFDRGVLKIFSPGGACKFNPTCSEYAIEAIEKHGVIRGGFVSIQRLVRCTPWNPGGNDPVR